MTSIIIGIAFFLGFFIEGIVGFGGLIISLALLGLFVDVKFAIILGIYIVLIASGGILIRDRRFFNIRLFFDLLPFIFVGGIIGFYFFSVLNLDLVKKVFSFIILLLSLQMIFQYKTYILPSLWLKIISIIGGIIQGFTGTGGPLFAYILQNQTQSYGELRFALAAIFFSSAVMRLLQGEIQGTINFLLVLPYWWIGIVIIFSTVLSGIFLQRVHIKIEKKLMGYFLFLIAILLLLQ